MDLDNNNNSASSGECVILPSSPIHPVLSAGGTETPERSTSKIRLSKAESVSMTNEFINRTLLFIQAQRKSERDAKKAEEEAIKAEKKRQKEECKFVSLSIFNKICSRYLVRAKKAEEIQQEKARKAEELEKEKARKAEEKARKAEELQQEKARKAEELEKEKARKAEEKARKEAEYA